MARVTVVNPVYDSTVVFVEPGSPEAHALPLLISVPDHFEGASIPTAAPPRTGLASATFEDLNQE